MSSAKLTLLRIREFFVAFHRKHVIRLLLILGAVVGLFWLAINMVGRPISPLENVHGTVETAFATGQRAPGYTSVTVRLDNGSRVHVDLPHMASFVRDARAELSVTSYDTGFGVGYRYKFIRYLEDGSEPAE